MKNTYKDGDIIVHVERRTGGGGFKQDAIWKVCCTRGADYSTDVIWTDIGCGVYPDEVRRATPDEVEWFNQGHSSIIGMPKIKELHYSIY